MSVDGIKIFTSKKYLDEFLQISISKINLKATEGLAKSMENELNILLIEMDSCRALEDQSGYPLDHPLVSRVRVVEGKTLDVSLFDLFNRKYLLQFNPLCSIGECPLPTIWIRRTQFSGIHHFCEKHALLEDFNESNSSYFFWERDS